MHQTQSLEIHEAKTDKLNKAVTVRLFHVPLSVNDRTRAQKTSRDVEKLNDETNQRYLIDI